MASPSHFVPAWASDLTTVGVTGTNGKTTTTTWIAAALARVARPVARATTLGYFLGDEPRELPLTWDGFLALMQECRDRGGRLASIELTSEALARGFARSWPCRVGVFTNLTHDHLDAHGSAEHYLASKAQLFVTLGAGDTAVLNACDPASELLREVIDPAARILSYGVPSRGAFSAVAPVDLRATEVVFDWTGTTVTCVGRDGAEHRPIKIRAIGEVYAENALAAVLGATAAGVPLDDAVDALAVAPPPPGRFEVIAEAPWLVVDYAHSPDALERTVAIARRLAPEQLVVVLGAGGGRDPSKRAAMGQAVRLADRVVITSDNPRDEDPLSIARAIAAGLEGHDRVTIELDRAAAITRAVHDAGPRDVVLVTGKGHETEQHVGAVVRRFSDADTLRAASAARAAR
jgi:UDP-N-acetylmuramoyl-L-alanyl-D-glutamate--2,6-diaminopimelate ligase